MSQSGKDPRRNLLKKCHGPGIWEDAAGQIHWSIVAELEDTPENREQIVAMLRELITKTAPAAKIIERQTPDD